MCTDIHITRGNFDESASKYPEEEVGHLLVALMGRPSHLAHSIPVMSLSLFQVIQVGGFKVGLCHGHQVRLSECRGRMLQNIMLRCERDIYLPAQIVPWGSNDAMALVQRKMDVDILITGHTHEFKVCAHAQCRHAPNVNVLTNIEHTFGAAQAFKYENRFLINPGSATGAFSSVTENTAPSFVLMDIDGTKVRRAVSSSYSGNLARSCCAVLNNSTPWLLCRPPCTSTSS